MACWKGMMLKFDFLRRAGTCALCVHMWHIRHIGDFSGKMLIFDDVSGSRKFFKKFSKNVFHQKSTQKHLISIMCSFEQNRRKIIDFRAFWNFRFFEFLTKNFKFSKFEQKKNFKFQNALKSRIFNILCWNRLTELQIVIRSV